MALHALLVLPHDGGLAHLQAGTRRAAGEATISQASLGWGSPLPPNEPAHCKASRGQARVGCNSCRQNQGQMSLPCTGLGRTRAPPPGRGTACWRSAGPPTSDREQTTTAEAGGCPDRPQMKRAIECVYTDTIAASHCTMLFLTDLHTQPGKRLPHLAGSQPQNCKVRVKGEVGHGRKKQMVQQLQNRPVRCACNGPPAVLLHKLVRHQHATPSTQTTCLFAEVGVFCAGAVGAAHAGAAAGEVLGPHLQASGRLDTQTRHGPDCR